VLRYTKHPAILIEGGFISNRTERGQMMDPQFRQVIADSIARGIIQFNRRRF
jgi:N-acetylmuramoyl-L-alanine amidase